MSEEMSVQNNAQNDVPAVLEQATETGMANVWQNKDQFNQLLRAAQMLSQTSIIPQNYQ